MVAVADVKGLDTKDATRLTNGVERSLLVQSQKIIPITVRGCWGMLSVPASTAAHVHLEMQGGLVKEWIINGVSWDAGPEHRTYQHAFLYITAEGGYYDIELRNQNGTSIFDTKMPEWLLQAVLGS